MIFKLAAGATVILVFTLNYWVFDPGEVLEATADYKNMVEGCDEIIISWCLEAGLDFQFINGRQ
ncbi:hypothetical protein [Microbulbifer variabilis]|uniref:hypothetical protein n=1 Tax=Microbulbifer variabilis TaxID=266805 RepID=UPI001CFC59D2|nr:hypothetical protein [Microbulbifer variabilis]